MIIAKNEAANIRRCLESLREFDDVVVVDDFSKDDTASIAASLGARVIDHHFVSFATQRNWALANAELRHDWVLMLDADEVMTAPLRLELVARIANLEPSYAAFLLCRRNWCFGRFLRHADGYPVWIMRLVHRRRAKFVDAGHGEVPVPGVNGIVGRIREPFLHYPLSRGLSEWIERHNTYSTREADFEFRHLPQWTWQQLLIGGRVQRRVALRNLARHVPGRGVLRFCHHYLWNLGFLDGKAGLAFSSLMATYERMIALKRWERELSVRG